MDIRKIRLDEIEEVMEIIKDAKELLRQTSSQWQDGYPNRGIMIEDINNERLYGEYIDSMLVGIAALVKGINIDYDYIEGKWLLDHSSNDLVIHRLAVRNNYHHLKIADSLFDFAYKYAQDNNIKSIKIDTHEKNKPMQVVCLRNGYKECGIIYVKREKKDPKRIAYEKEVLNERTKQ